MTQGEAHDRLTDLLAVYNNGWQPNWEDNTYKVCISRCGSNLICISSQYDYHLLAFKDWQSRKRFMRENLELIRQFFGL